MGARCLLTSVNTTTNPYPVYPLGLAHVAGSLTAAGHQVVQIDRLSCGDSYFDTLKQTIERHDPELIGVSIRNLDLEDSSRPQSFIAEVKVVVDFIRSHCRAPIVVGGPAFSLLPEKILSYLQADYGVVGEGETALVWLAGTIKSGDAPKSGIIRRPPEPAPWPKVEYDPTISGHYTRTGGMMNLQTKRGCPYTCNYCSYPLLEGRQLRKRDPVEVAAEAIRLKQEFNAAYLFFTDSVFNDPQGHYLEVCEELIRAGNTLPWTGYFRPEPMKDEAMALMKRAGLDAMEIGTDGGCDRILTALDKSFTIDDAMALNHCAARFKIPCAHFIMFGGPGENLDTLDQSLNNIERLKPSVVFAFNGIRILPGTGIHKLAIEQRLLEPEDDLLEPKFYVSPDITLKEIDSTLRSRWANRPDRIYPSSDGLSLIRQFHAKGHAGPIWDKIIRMGLAHG